MIGRDDLEVPEDGLALEKREEPEEKPKTYRKTGPAAELAALRDEHEALLGRVRQARKIGPPRGFHCRDCFGKARDVVLAAVEGE